jgi:hypothetical protein
MYFEFRKKRKKNLTNGPLRPNIPKRRPLTLAARAPLPCTGGRRFLHSPHCGPHPQVSLSFLPRRRQEARRPILRNRPCVRLPFPDSPSPSCLSLPRRAAPRCPTCSTRSRLDPSHAQARPDPDRRPTSRTSKDRPSSRTDPRRAAPKPTSVRLRVIGALQRPFLPPHYSLPPSMAPLSHGRCFSSPHNAFSPAVTPL